MITLDATLLAFLTGTVIPLATGVVTKLHAPRGVKALVSAVLAAVVGVVARLTDFAGVLDWKTAAYVGFAAFITHVAAYRGFLQPTGVAEAVQESTATVGLG